MPPEKVARKRIAIIGGGTAGLAALKTFVHDIPKSLGEEWDITLYEQRQKLGGVWLADSEVPHEPRLPQTPLYPRLHTNTPNPTMTYPGFPFPHLTPLFPSYEYIQRYHEDYTEHHNLTSYIKLNHSVSSVLWVGDSSKGYWDVTIRTGYPVEIIPGTSLQLARDRKGEYVFTRQFDHLVVANGHNHYPMIPQWARNKDWLDGRKDRRIIHSIYYREPLDYIGKKVLVVGAGASGVDVASQVCQCAEETYHSFRYNPKRPPFKRLPNVIYKPVTSNLTRSSVVFEDRSEAPDIDIIILATGYEYRIPFLCESDPYAYNPSLNKRLKGRSVLVTDRDTKSRPDGPIASNLNYVFPVDRQIVSLSSLHPLNALTFIGLPVPIANAPSDIVQALFVGHLIANPRLIFPGPEDIVRENLLDKLTSHENRLRDQGYDPYVIGQRLVGENNTELDYQEEIYSHLKSMGAIPDDGRNFVEQWRIDGRRNARLLKDIWTEVERRGDEMKWLEGVRTEEEWADLLNRLLEWGDEIGL